MRTPGSYGKLPDPPLVLLLGPVGVHGRNNGLITPPPTGRALLAALSLVAGEVVPAQRLRDTVWPGGDVGRAGLQTAIHRLRLWLDEHAVTGLDLVTLGSGYQLNADTDLARFRGLVRRTGEAGDLERMELLAQAMALWAGEPLANVPAGRRDEEVVRNLRRERLAIVRQAAAAAVRAGYPGLAVEWLVPLADANPLDEPTQAAVIETLLAAGRPGEARSRYEGLRQLLADQLGVDPGERLQAAHRRLVRPRGASTTPDRAPCTLPADLADFTGRGPDLVAIRQALAASRLVVISGPGGFGSTALAVHAAHALRAVYPAGQLFASGAGALAQFERQWRAPLPGGSDLLLVADAAPDVTTLVAGRPREAALIITVRERPPAGIAHVRLGALSPDESRELLTRVAARSLDTEPAALGWVVRACGGSPLALRRAGALLARRPHWTLDDLANYLDETTYLDRDDLPSR